MTVSCRLFVFSQLLLDHDKDYEVPSQIVTKIKCARTLTVRSLLHTPFIACIVADL